MIPQTSLDAEQVLASESHRNVTSSLDMMLSDAGIPYPERDREALHAVQWSSATPESTRVHLYRALDSFRAEQVMEIGLDRFLALRKAFRRKSLRQPALADLVLRRTGSLSSEALRLVVKQKQNLLAFLGSQKIGANSSGVEFDGCLVMHLQEALGLASRTPGGILRLREKLAYGEEAIDRFVSEAWDQWAAVLKADFFRMLGQEHSETGPTDFLNAFPQALICRDWRDALAEELGARKNRSLSSTRARPQWRRPLSSLTSPKAKRA